MKQLILVRHGKSSWDYSVSDKDRPLKERGINDGHLVSSRMQSEDVAIDAIFSSPANRALHTCMIFMRQLALPFSKFQLSEQLYDFSGEGVFEFLKSLDDQLETVMIFGHNHAFTHVANTLGNRYIDNVPTTGLVHLELPIKAWELLAKGTTVRTFFPKELRR